jgi:hypothetical protein
LPFDGIIYLMGAFLVISAISILDAPAKLRAVLATGQYLPYFFVAYVTIAVVRTEAALLAVLRTLYPLAFCFSAMLIVVAVATGSRKALDTFLLDYFILEVMKVMVLLQLPFAVVTYRWFSGRGGLGDLVVMATSWLAVFLSGSRGSLGGAVLTLGLTMLVRGSWRRKVAAVIGGVVLGVLSLTMADYVSDRLRLMVVTSEQDYEQKITAFSRIYTGLVAFELMRARPINGTGIANLSYFSLDVIESQLKLPPRLMDFWKKHYELRGKVWETTTTPLKFGAELGVAGMIYFFVFYAYLWRRVRTAMRSRSVPFDMPAIAIFVVTSFAQNIVDLGFTNYYTWFFYGIALAATRLCPDAGGGDPPINVRRA